MITLNEKIALETGIEAKYKSKELTVNYETSLVTILVDDVPTKVGQIRSWVCNENGINIMGVQRIDNDATFTGLNILGELHLIYLAQLEQLNPTLEFTDTYNTI